MSGDIEPREQMPLPEPPEQMPLPEPPEQMPLPEPPEQMPLPEPPEQMPLPEPPEQMPLPEPPESIAQRLRRIQQKARELKKENKTLHERLNSRGSALEQATLDATNGGNLPATTSRETKNSHDSVDAFAGMQREILAEYEQLLREQQAEIRALQEQLSKMDSNVSSNQGNSTPAVDDSSYCSQPSLLCRWLACVYGSGNDDARSELKNTHGVLRTTVLPAETTPPGL